ncbi:MAG: VCBS repeat-containing protein [Deltaproteobacteria bacterium]|nr:VCBS repeat-containing protein [Deltaproteobacteria bacterium]
MTINKSSLRGRLLLAFLFIFLLPSVGLARTSRVLVLPWKVNAAENLEFLKSAMLDMLTTRIGAAEVEVISPEALKEAMPALKSGDVTDSTAASAGRRLKADFVLYGSLTVIGGSVSLDAKLLNVTSGAITPFYSKGDGVDSVIGLVGRLSAEAAAAAGGTVKVPPIAPAKAEEKKAAQEPVAPKGEEFIIKPKEEPGRWKSGLMEGMYLAFTAGDLNKDGVKELFLITKKSLTIAVIKPEGLEVVKKIDSGPGVDFVAITSIDSDNDGSPEVYISGVRDYRPYTSLLEYGVDGYRITRTGIRWLVKAVQTDSGSVLIGQGFTYEDGFSGGLRVLRKEGDGLADKGSFTVTLPFMVDIYRFDTFGLTDKESELVALDDREYIRIYRKGEGGGWEKSWKSREFYGGTLDYIDLGGERYAAVEGGFFHADTDGDGRFELIIKRNVPGGLGRFARKPGSYDSAEVLSLSWDRGEEGLKVNWKTREVKGYIADFLIDDMNKDGAKEILLLVVEGTESLTGGQKSYVLMDKLSVK